MDFEQLTTQYLAQEDFSQTVYRCEDGFLRIGAGRNIETLGLTEKEVFYLAKNDLANASKTLINQVRGWTLISPSVQIIWLRLLIQMGEQTLFGYSQFVDLLCAQQFEAAALELQSVDWSIKLPNRSMPLINSLYKIAEKSS